MQANDTKLQPLIEGTKQYLVPLFQRPYSWDKPQWKTLWEDIDELTKEGAGKTHFMGAIVTMPAHTIPEGITKYLLIDGQQRLTTILVLLVAIRDKAKSIAGNLFAKIQENFLTNKFNEDEDYYKLLPTQLDRPAFIDLVQEKETPPKTKIKEAYTYFVKQLGEASKDDLERIFNTVIGKLNFVSIVLAMDDNAYLIFEGLNAKGLPLTQADLIRNYLLMRIHRKRQDSVFETHWLPMQTAMGSNLTEFIRHFLMRNSTFIKLNEVYATLKTGTDNYGEKETIAYLETLGRFSAYYHKLINPESEVNPKLQKSLVALKRLDVTTAYPFLLDLLDDLACKRCTEDVFVHILKMLETFLVRRFVCAVPAHDLNKFFPTLLSDAKQYPSLTEGIADILAKRRFPRNSEFRRNLLMMRMYGSGERAVKTKLVLERLEESFGHKEEIQAKELTIEHIMPQTLTDWWKAHLGEHWEQIHERFVHTIGNLTLTGYNPNLSNSTFPEKCKIYADSHVEMNKSIMGDKWTGKEITERIGQLYERAIAIWPSLTNESEEELDESVFEDSNGSEDSLEPAMTATQMLEILGGGELITATKYCYRLKDGMAVLFTPSKAYPKGKPFWYGISLAALKAVEAHGCSHVAFCMGLNRIALVPADLVKGYVKNCTSSKYKNGSVHHYHFFVSNADKPELFGNEDSPRISVADYIRKR